MVPSFSTMKAAATDMARMPTKPIHAARIFTVVWPSHPNEIITNGETILEYAPDETRIFGHYFKRKNVKFVN